MAPRGASSRRSRRVVQRPGGRGRALGFRPTPPAGSTRQEDGTGMSALPDRANVVVIGAGIVGNSLAYHLALAGWRDIVLLDKGTLPNPGGSTGHASNFIFLTDHSKEMTAFTLESVRQYQELGVFTQSGGIEVARTPERMEELKRRMASSTSWGIEAELLTPGRGQGARPVHRRDGHPRRLLHPGRRRRRLAPGRHADARARPVELGALTIGRGRRGRPGSTSSDGRDPARPHRRGRHRGRRRRHRLRRLEPADRADGRRVDPADAGRPPDDQRRPGPALRRHGRRDQVPDRARHGHQHVRAPARRRPRGRLVRPPADPHGPRRHPVDRGVRAVADRAAVHPGGLRAPDGAGARARPGDRSATRRSASATRSTACCR